MPKRRVYELADELGYSKQELVTKINSLGLSFSVGNYMTVLSPTEVEALKRAIKSENKAEKKEKTEKPKAPAKTAKAKNDAGGSVVVRRRKKKSADLDAEENAQNAEDVANTTAVKPVIRRRKVVSAGDDVQEPVSKDIDDAAELVSEDAAMTESSVSESADGSADDITENHVDADNTAEAVKDSEEVASPVDASAGQDAESTDVDVSEQTVVEGGDASTTSAGEIGDDTGEVEKDTAPESNSEADEKVDEKVTSTPAPTPETQAVRPTTRRPTAKKRGGAKVLGMINETVLKERLASEGKDFSPGVASSSGRSDDVDEPRGGRQRRNRTKRVVEGRDLYDSKSRRGKKRNSRGRSRGRQKDLQTTEITQAAEHKRHIKIEDVISVGDLAHQMGIKAAQVAMKLLESGMMATVNTMLDFETAAILAEDFGYTVENVAFDIANFYDTAPDAEETLQTRPPVVTVMGHVDHGKTSLLDVVRESAVTSGEAGGITQHIGAYTVKTPEGRITFLDTPGHEAFTALRARGAKATDIVILVVAADDGVMPQTVEAIHHARAAEVPIIVAINKIDKPSANPERVKTALTEYELIPEDWGGSTLFVEVSAKERINIDGLLSAIMLQSELEEFQANPDRDAQGLVVEAELDIGRGPVATVLVQRGTLHKGDIIVSGRFYGRVRTMQDDKGQAIVDAGPSTPIEITGLSGIPEAGEPFFVVQDEKNAKRITENVDGQRRKETMASRAKAAYGTLEDLSAAIREGELKELKVILKGDTQGSVEALREAFMKLGNEEVRVKIIHLGVGGITENDVNLAASSDDGAVIVGFNVRPDNRALEVAEKYGVQVLSHNIIYDAIAQVRDILEGLLSPIIEERVLGHAEVRDTFSAPKVGVVAGCYVTDGILRRNANVRLLRDGRIVYDTTIGTLRRFKDDVKEVKTGFECGASLDNYSDIKIGDILEVYENYEVSATLD